MSALFQLGADATHYRRVGDGGTSEAWRGGTLLTLEPESLARLAAAAFTDLAHLLRPAHLAQVRAILEDPEASRNDRFVPLELLQNAAPTSTPTSPRARQPDATLPPRRSR